MPNPIPQIICELDNNNLPQSTFDGHPSERDMNE